MDLVRSDEDLGDDYMNNDFTSTTTEEILNARPLAAVVSQDAMTRATLAATTIFTGAEDHREVLLRKLWGQYKSSANNLNRSAAFSALSLNPFSFNSLIRQDGRFIVTIL